MQIKCEDYNLPLELKRLDCSDLLFDALKEQGLKLIDRECIGMPFFEVTLRFVQTFKQGGV